MADAVISVVVERFAAIIEDQIRNEVNLVRGMEKELLNLSDKLKTIRNVLDDAEKRGVNDQSVKSWLKKLEAMAYEMDDILDEWNYTLLKHKMEDSKMEASAEQKVCCSFLPSSCLSFKKVTAKKIENLNATLDQILKEKDEFDFVVSLPSTDHVSSHWKIQSTSSIELEQIEGADIDRNKNLIVSKLMLEGSKHTQILCIVGIGGLGKTTLAQLVYNDTRLVNDSCFDLRIWVCVSDTLDVAGVARGIVESVTKVSMPTNINQLGMVLEKLRDCISGKRFLLVLDDVWTDRYEEWEPLKINLRNGAAGSKILVTTRKTTVAKMMDTLDDDIYHPQQLSEDERWLLMRRTSLSGRSEEDCGVLEKVGKKIASKCNGLPLAANVLGRLLQLKTSLEEWEDVDKSQIWELVNAKVDLFPHLVLSYNELSPSLKRCFSYCADYPKDHRFHAKTLIEEWMALGYLGPVSGNRRVELKGREYLKILAMRCLIQDIEKSKSGEQIEWCKMHDIVHDFALFLRKNDGNQRSCQVCDPSLASHVQEYRSLSWDYITPIDERDRSCKVCDCMKSLRVLRIRGRLPPVGMETLIHLRWLDCSYTSLSKDDLEIICRLYFLQTLLLSSCELTEIPQEIGNLFELRHLDFGGNWGIEQLPESICSLVELQILNIAGIDLNCLPEALGELSNLCTLEWGHKFKVGNGYNKFGLLKKLCHHLNGFLSLEIYFSSMSELVELVEDVRLAKLKTLLQKLEVLKISFNDTMNEEELSSSSIWMEAVEALVPHHKLNQLKIWGYKDSKLPNWMSSPLNCIKQIELRSASELSSLPVMGKLPLLESLCVWNVEQLMFVGREFLGIESSSDDVIVAFPKLRKLQFIQCSKWEEWEDITEEEEESAAISIMPCLTYLIINECESLKKLPHRLLRKVSSSLRLLDISDSSVLKKTYGEDKEGSAWRSISQHNPQLVLCKQLFD